MKLFRWKSCVMAAMIVVMVGYVCYAERIYSVTSPAFSGGFDFKTGTAYYDSSVLIVTFSEQPDIEDVWKTAWANLADFGEENGKVMFAFNNDSIFVRLNAQHIASAAIFPEMTFDGNYSLLLNDSYLAMPAEIIEFKADDVIILQTSAQTYWKFENFTRLRDFTVRFDVATNSVPEPTTFTLFLISCVGLIGAVRLKFRNARYIKTFMRCMFSAIGIMASIPASAQTFSCSSVTQIPNAECDALEALYDSTSGIGWKDHTGWLQTNTPCSWFGVTCEHGNVTYLRLENNGLNGSIPDEIGNLTNLKLLRLIENQLQGAIPETLGNLVNLIHLDMRSNQLTSLPVAIGNLTNLQGLSLHNNLLTSLPSQIGSLKKLQGIDLSWNPLETLPTEFGQLTQMQTLRLHHTELQSIPEWLFDFTRLQELFISSNPLLTGQLPQPFEKFTELKSFYFDGTNLCEPQDAAFQAWLNAIPNLTRTNIACAPEIKEFKTLILINRQQLANLHGGSAADQVMSKLKTFAAHSAVSGMIAEAENDAAVAAAYAARGTVYENKDNANAVADAIKQVILKEWNAHPELEYLVIVGDDRVIPFYRAKDGTTIPDPWTLTDDFYVSRGPGFFLPELASGRLVESPSQMLGQLDAFLSKQDVTLRQGVVTGYDAFQDGAQYQCATLQDAQVASDCSLIGNAWTSDAFRAIILNEPHDVVSINNHADSHGFGTPDGGFISDSDIAAAATDFSRAIWYSIGCHAGLNLAGETDLAETLAAKRAIYTANTGYGWGGLGVILSEKLMWYFTQQLAVGRETTVGNALISAKQKYYSELPFMNARHEKILTENTLYGLPMYRVISGAAAPAPVNPITTTVQASVLANGLSKEVRAYSWALPTPENGYYALNGNMTDENGKPVLPVLIDDLATMADRAHGVVFMGGVYAIVNAAPPLQKIITTQTTASFSGAQTFASPGWYPATFGAFNTLDLLDGRRQTLIATAGQYNPNLAAGQQRIFTAMTFDVYAHANSADFTAPTLSGVTATLQGNTATITAQANDASGIETVVAAYTDGSGAWRSVNLTQTGAEWMGSIPAAAQMEFFAQAVDKAGNVAVDDHDGAYFTLPMFTVRKAAKNTGSGVIMLGKERCDADCMELSVPVSLTTTLIVKAVAAPDSRFARWERPDGTPIAQHNFRAKPGGLVIAVFERKK